MIASLIRLFIRQIFSLLALLNDQSANIYVNKDRNRPYPRLSI